MNFLHLLYWEMSFRLNPKWGSVSVQSPLPTTSSSFTSLYSCKCKDDFNLFRLSSSSLIYRETEMLGDTSRVQALSSSSQLLDNWYLGTGEIEMLPEKGPDCGLFNWSDNNVPVSIKEDELAYLSGLQPTKESQFKLLIKNIDTLEDVFADTDVVRLERDILKQLERLGALRYFHSCLSRMLQSSTLYALSNAPTDPVEELKVNDSKNNQAFTVAVQSGKKEYRKLRRRGLVERKRSSSLKDFHQEINDPWHPKIRSSRLRNKRQKVARNEAELSSGVKMVAELEKIRLKLEAETGEVASFSLWADAARLEKEELRHRLHYGWYCMDELLRSTRSLVLFIARNYWGRGIAMEDLIQAGNVGILEGAERFDKSRGYKFSTYVQYWIRKSMSKLISKHARGIRIPYTLSKTINQVQKARKVLSIIHGKYPDDVEISKFTGLSVAKIGTANECLRVVGSITQKIGDNVGVKFLEVMPDTSIIIPEEAVMRQHTLKGMNTLLQRLEPREIQVLTLRFGLGNHQRKTLEEIGRLFGVSKEWIRKIERTALTKLQTKNSL